MIQNDVKSTTGRNLRNILLGSSKSKISQLDKSDASCFPYHPIAEENVWRVAYLWELVDVKNDILVVENFSQEEL